MINQKLGRVAVAPKGEWSAGTYTRLDVVTHGGQGFICSSAETSEEPGTGSAWQLIATKGRDFTYSDFTEEQIAGLMKPATDAATEVGKTNEEYKAMLTEQAKAFGDAQQARAGSYTDAERARDRAYTKAETGREAAYNEAEGKRKDAERVRGENEGSRKSAEQTRSTAENERAEAEGGRKQAEQTRDTAEKARVKAEGEREQGWTDLKAEAEKSVGDAQAAIAEVKATEAKLYPVAENVLRGTAKDTFVHVDDAFPSSLLSIEIEGACKQDGTPSPDNPVPIKVIENPVVRVTGRNVLELKPKMVEQSTNGITFTPTGDSGIRITGTSTDVAFYNLDFGDQRRRSIEPFIGSRVVWDTHYLEVGCELANGAQGGFNDGIVQADARFWRSYLYIREIGKTYDEVVYPSAYVDKLGTYAPYVSTSTPITLPAEHPYLAKLPDGIADTIEVDKDGNVSLVARVQKVDMSNLHAPSASDVLNNGLTRYQYWSAIDTPAMNDTPVLAPAFASVVNYMFPTQGMYVSGVSIIVGASAEPTEALKAGGYIYTTLATPVTYPLGKVTVPSLPDSISNVWTDAELTPRTGIEYVRDVNIAFANIEDAIASITQG